MHPNFWTEIVIDNKERPCSGSPSMSAFKQCEAISREAQSDITRVGKEFMIEFEAICNYKVVAELSVMDRIKYV
jgi:hypothetical protein